MAPASPSFIQKQRDLRADIRLLGDTLGQVLQAQGGQALFEHVEAMRKAAKSARETEPGEVHRRACEELTRLSQSLEPGLALEVVRAFTLYFQLVNVAEDVHRTRVLRQRLIEGGEGSVAESFQAVLGELCDRGASEEEIFSTCQDVALGFVFTAHPTEARRRTTERLLAEVREALEFMDRDTLTPIEERRSSRKLCAAVEALWQHAAERSERPEVLEEVKAGLWYLRHILLDALPRVERRFYSAWCTRFGERDPLSLPAMVSFGSWMGGDRDGNPFVTDAVTERTLELHRWIITERYTEDLDALVDPLASTAQRLPETPSLDAALARASAAVPEIVMLAERRNPHEPLRRLISFMRERVLRTRSFSPGAYPNAQAFLEDLSVVRSVLLEAKANALANDLLLDLMYRVRSFGFHLAPLDVREDGREHRKAMAEFLEQGDYASLDQEQRIRAQEKLDLPSLRGRVLSPEARRILDCFGTVARCQARFGAEALHSYIISMTEDAGDVLEVFALAKAHRIDPYLDIVPLFETKAALDGASDCLERLLASPEYRKHLRARGDVQEVLVGYSDSMKENGILASRAGILGVQERLSFLAEKHGIKIRFFHGRGGSVSRGGGPTYRAIRALPPHVFSGKARITEQGETRSYHFANPDLAIRYLEQGLGAALALRYESRSAQLSAAVSDRQPAPGNITFLEELAETSRLAYRRLVEDDGLVRFFEEATPFRSITELQIASRPSKRKGSRPGLSDLRAIPWVFSWAQARTLMTAWYGVGSALQEGWDKKGQAEALQQRYAEDLFFRDILDNVQMTLAKADLDIAKRYAALCEDEDVRTHIFGSIAREFETTKAMVLRVSGHQSLLDADPVVQNSIRLRNPYVDPISYIQVEALRRVRGESDEVAQNAWRRVARVAVQGIAAGLRNTG